VTEPFADERFEPEVLEHRRAFTGRVWDVVSESFPYHDETLHRDYVDHPGAVAVAALDEADRLCCIRQYRHPVRAREWELPAGLLDVDGEPPLEAARRELAEEVDLTAASWHLLADFMTSPGGSDEAVRVFLARDLAPAASDYVRRGEERDLLLRWVPLEEAVEAVREGRVQNAIIQIAVLAAWVERQRGWRGLRDPGTPWPRHRARGR